MFMLSLLVGVLGVTTAFQHNWWENQWSDGKSNNNVGGAHYNQIDFRYPDWVVNPRPPCTSEGVFPHPRSSDCTWYYRCTARVGIPRYATFYFQCEPGTMFEDDLDQCVHPHSGYNCQGGISTQPPVTCTPVQSTCGNYPVCGGGSKYMCRQEQCTDGRVKDLCSFGQLKDMATRTCMAPPADCPETCTPLQSSCGNYQVCGGSSKYMCRQEQCTPSGRVRDYCSFGKLKDMATGTCMDPPQSCPEPDPTKCVAIDCKQVQVCTPTRSTRNICENERCTRGGVDIGTRRMCENNQVYDADNKRCITRPNENTCSCEYTATNCREYDLCNPSGVRRLCDCDLCGSGMMYDPTSKVCVDKSILCPTLECVFRDSVCNCVNGMSLCTGCFMRGNLVHVSQFCKVQPNAEFYHVEKDSCLYSDPGFFRASPGHCPRSPATRDSLLTPSLTCSLRDNSIIRCYGDDMN